MWVNIGPIGEGRLIRDDSVEEHFQKIYPYMVKYKIDLISKMKELRNKNINNRF